LALRRESLCHGDQARQRRVISYDFLAVEDEGALGPCVLRCVGVGGLDFGTPVDQPFGLDPVGMGEKLRG
jgi:hypothetical protein